jgi:putative DNA primase/helicase
MAPVKAEVGGRKAEGGKELVPAKRTGAKPEAGGPKPKGKTERLTNRPPESIGKLKIEEYLRHYAREIHSIDTKGASTWYILSECVFDASHKAKDAAIIQSDQGLITYKCFHNSCNGKTWPEARVEISGTESLIRFCENYDPNWKPADSESLGEGIVSAIEIAPVHVEVGAPELPRPTEIDPMEFFAVRGNHGRPAFVVQAMANYLAAFLAPLVCTDGQFWRYRDGVWKRLHEDTVKQIVAQCLKDRVQADWIKGSMQVLAALTNRLEEQWPANPYLINVKNGVVDLEEITRNGNTDVSLERLLKPHDPAQGCRVQLPVTYNPDAEHNLWVKTLWQIFPEMRERECKPGELCLGDHKVALLQQFGGYLLLPTCKFERALLMVGGGANGKSTVIDTLVGVIGKENTVEMGVDDLSRPFNIPYLQSKMLVACTEMTHREASAISMLKKCISGDMVSGEWKYKQRVDFYPTAKFVFALNEVPSIVDKSYGFTRKILVINFSQRFEGDRKDVDMKVKLQAERDGIFFWMLLGACELLRRRRFSEDELELQQEKLEFIQQSNPLALFLSEECIQDEKARVAGDVLHGKYIAWAQQAMLQPMGKIKFYSALANLVPQAKKGRYVFGVQQRYGYSGIGLKET